MTFPLGTWVTSHSELPYNLSQSGMIGELTGTRLALTKVRLGTIAELRSRLSQLHGVAPNRLFLTHGATEGNALVLQFLERCYRRARGRQTRFRTVLPEYPTLVDSVRTFGYRWVGARSPADVTAFSNPNNPTGHLLTRNQLADRVRGCRSVLVDEAFREFTRAPPLATHTIAEFWTTGTFTKIYGADEIRLGYVIVPERWQEPFERFHGIAMDDPAARSIAVGHAILDRRRAILRQARRLFSANLRFLRSAVLRVPSLAAPLWFDRGPGALPGDSIAQEGIRRGILVCPGSFFGDPTGVRLCLTRRTFPGDLLKYLDLRGSFLDSSYDGAIGGECERPR